MNLLSMWRHPERAECAEVEATLGALVMPAPSTAQSEQFRKATGDAMQRAFTRATAPEKAADPNARSEVKNPEVVSVDGVAMAHLETRFDSRDDANAVLAIVAKHRATTR